MDAVTFTRGEVNLKKREHSLNKIERGPTFRAEVIGLPKTWVNIPRKRPSGMAQNEEICKVVSKDSIVSQAEVPGVITEF